MSDDRSPPAPSARSLVGCWVISAPLLNATTPILIVLGCCVDELLSPRSWRRPSASARGRWPACCWTRRTPGSRCPRDAGRPTLTCGRAKATTMRASAIRNSDGRHVARRRSRRAAAFGVKPSAASAAAPALRRLSVDAHVRSDGERHQHEEDEHARRDERHQRLCLLRLSTIRTSARTRSSSVDTSYRGVPACLASCVDLGLALPCGRVAEAPPELRVAACRRTTARRSRRPRRRSSRRRGASSSRGSTRRMAMTSWRSVNLRHRPLPARLADEVGDDEHERAPSCDAGAGLDQLPQVGAAARLGGRPQQLVGKSQHLHAPVAWRDRPLDRVVVQDRPDAVAAACQHARQRDGHLDEHRLLRPRRSGRSPSTAERSSSSHAVSSRSSRKVRTWATSVRAVTFQSMWRTSSPGSYSRRSATSTPDAAEHRAVVALQVPVEPADHPPLQAAQQAFRSLDGRWRHRRELAVRAAARRGRESTAITLVRMVSALTLSASASYDSTTRWRSTSSARSVTSWGSA